MQQHKGFSLLEILVAFSIMAVALTIVLRIFGTGVNNAMLADEYANAVQIAESILAKAGTDLPLQTGETSAIEAHKYQWRLQMREVTPPQAAPATADNQAFPWLLFNVIVDVEWGDDQRQHRSLQLSSLKLSRARVAEQ